MTLLVHYQSVQGESLTGIIAAKLNALDCVQHLVIWAVKSVAVLVLDNIALSLWSGVRGVSVQISVMTMDPNCLHGNALPRPEVWVHIHI